MEKGIFGGKAKALTFSFDDGVLEDVRVVEIMNKYGLKGTFNLNSGLLTKASSWFYKEKEVKHVNYFDYPDLYKGHEVASHSYTHPYPDLLVFTHDDIVNQIKLDKKILEHLFDQKVEGFAYPMGTYNEDLIEILKENGFKYARTIESTNGFGLPEDAMIWHPTCHFLDDNVEEMFHNFLAAKGNAVFYIWGHTYELMDEADFEKFERLCKLFANREEIAYCTNLEIINAMNTKGKRICL